MTAFSAQILTLFPEMFPGPLGLSLAGKALENGLWVMETLDIRDFAVNKHRTVDDTPAGGGPGMVLKPDIVAAAIDDARSRANPAWPLIYLSPRGTPLRQEKAAAILETGGVTLLCGRFEGVDERVLEAREVEEVSIGDYILSGGELAAMVLLDAAVRLIPGVVGAGETHWEESFTAGLLEYPQYTRPTLWEGREIPPVLLSGHHGNIAAWRREKAIETTRQRRPDLYEQYRRSAKVEEQRSKE